MGEHPHPIRVVIAEDETLIRRGLELTLTGSEFQVVAMVATADELLSAIATEQPDLVLTDIRMPPGFTDEGLAAAKQIKQRWPHLPVCVLSQYVLAGPAGELAALGGGIGYLIKQHIAEGEAFLDDLRHIVAGQVVLAPELVARLVAGADPLSTLTVRQREVLALAAEGHSNQAIAATLFITEHTVNQYLSRIYTTLGVSADDNTNTRVKAVLAYLTAPTPTHRAGESDTISDS
jgi:DNA-binding NarL/FixJ family response regulator